MRRFLAIVAIVLSTAAFPISTGLVTDQASVLTSEERAGLETKLRAFEQKTSVEFAVVTVNSLDGMTVEDYASKLLSAWGIGKRQKDNGVLLLLAPTEGKSGKVRIEVGYGLEALLTDGATGEILRTVVVPGWRSSHRANGILAGADAIMAKLSQPTPERAVGTTATDPMPVQTPPEDYSWVLVLCGVVFLASLIAVLLARRRNAAYEEYQARRRQKIQNEVDHLPSAPAPPSNIGYAKAFTSVRTEPTRRSSRRETSEPAYVPIPVQVYEPSPAPVYESPRSDPSPSYDSGGSSSSFDFGGGSSGGGGSSSDL